MSLKYEPSSEQASAEGFLGRMWNTIVGGDVEKPATVTLNPPLHARYTPHTTMDLVQNSYTLQWVWYKTVVRDLPVCACSYLGIPGAIVGNHGGDRRRDAGHGNTQTPATCPLYTTHYNGSGTKQLCTTMGLVQNSC